MKALLVYYTITYHTSLWTSPKASEKDVQKCIKLGEELGKES